MHDAWDIDHNFDEEHTWEPGRAESVEVLEWGPVRGVVKIVRRTQRSTFTQYLTMHACHPRIEVRLEVDWNEKHTLLKVAFPIDVLTHRATYDIQFGAIERATHRNTEHARGRFEAPAQKWADLSEGDYGASLLNDCKYGYDVKDNLLRLSLLRSPVDPDPHADEGFHEMVYALHPHAGDWRQGTVQQACMLNQRLIAVVPKAGKPGTLAPIGCFAAIDAENVLIETVKKHEDSDAVILRLFEAFGQRGEATLTFGKRPKSVSECDMMEENDQKLKHKGHEVTLYLKPFEIRTFKISF